MDELFEPFLEWSDIWRLSDVSCDVNLEFVIYSPLSSKVHARILRAISNYSARGVWMMITYL